MIRFLTVVSAFVAFAIPTATLAAPSVQLKAGETITLSLAGDGVTVVERAPAQGLSLFEAEALKQMQAHYQTTPEGTGVVPPMPLETASRPKPLTPATIRMTLRMVPGDQREGTHAMLTIENGYGRMLAYRAAMQANGRAAHTDVCDVLAGKPGFEHWPYPFESLQLSDFELVDRPPGVMNCR